MTLPCKAIPNTRNGKALLHAVAAAATLVVLSGCSATPDWANPMEWYRGTRDAITGEEKAESGSEPKAANSSVGEKPIPNTDKEFPNLASVPERPPAPTEEQREKMERELVADRKNARYTDEVIRRQTESVAPPLPAQRQQSSSSGGESAVAPQPVSAPPTVPAPASEPSSAVGQPASASRSASPAAIAPADTSASREELMRAAAEQVKAPWRPAVGADGQPSTAAAGVRPLPPIQSREPQFASPPPPPPQMEGEGSLVRSLNNRPTPSTRSVARIGNPTFGPPPADIAASLEAGTPPAAEMASVAPYASPPGTLASPSSPVAGEKAAVIHFSMGSSSLDPRDRQQIERIVQAYRSRGGAIRVEGHASSRTKDMRPVNHHLVNFDISLTRANAVAAELIRQGVPAEAVFVAALSDSQPIFYEVMPAGEAGNQRVEIYFVN